VIVANKAYAWEDKGKFFLSKLPFNPAKKPPPANQYDTKDGLAAAARARKMTVEWYNNPN
jgi:hypothetical protein